MRLCGHTAAHKQVFTAHAPFWLICVPVHDTESSHAVSQHGNRGTTNTRAEKGAGVRLMAQALRRRPVAAFLPCSLAVAAFVAAAAGILLPGRGLMRS